MRVHWGKLSYSTNTPIFTPRDSKRKLLFYVSMTLTSLGEMLAQKDDEGKERSSIFY